ncbi:MAG: hypothetical protein ACI4TK_14730 [Agathobacter sp.]
MGWKCSCRKFAYTKAYCRSIFGWNKR